jgi:hypothetical protein
MKLLFTFSVLTLSFCSLSQVDILVENFDATTLPTGWAVVDNDGNTPDQSVSEYTEAWIYKEDPLNIGNGTFSSTSFFDPVDRADRWLISSQITLGAESNYISWKGLSGDASFPDSYKVMISTGSNDIADFTDTLVVISNELPEWTERLFNMDDYANQTIHLAFVNTTFDGFKLYIDSLYVREQDPLSIEEYQSSTKSTNIYPNPAENIVNISGANVESTTIQNLAGKIVFETNNLTEKSIEISEFPSGIYIVSILLSDGTIERHKLVKK